MGSFTSVPKVVNEDSQDNDLDLPEKMSKDELLEYCSSQLGSSQLISRTFNNLSPLTPPPELQTSSTSKLRVLQWNLLSQTLGVNNDNFVCCPDEALRWSRRRNLVTSEIVKYSPDVICLQEVDHFNYLKKILSTQGYEGIFFPKPDSPCIYIKDNNGPDGCAIFFLSKKYELLHQESRILEVWSIQSNQVAIVSIMKDRETGAEICVATTHLKARSGALLAALRNEQGKDLLTLIRRVAGGRPVILCGDFNAEPSEPLYSTVTGDDTLNLGSAYASFSGCEPPYTTWKVRQEGEVCHTIDYIFYSRDKLRILDTLQFPTADQIGVNRVPSMTYPSDHFSLVCDIDLNVNMVQ